MKKITSIILLTAMYAILSAGCAPPKHLAPPPPPPAPPAPSR